MSQASAAFYAGIQQGARQLRSLPAVAVVAASLALCAIFAYAQRQSGSLQAVDMSLQGIGFGFAIPLASMALVAIVVQAGCVQQASQALAGIGASRRLIALSLLLVGAIASLLLGAVIAGVTVTVAYGAAVGGAWSDIATTIWIGGLGGFTYGAYFMMASAYGKKGRARWWAFIADWIVGIFGGAVGLVFPKAHIMNLIGVHSAQLCSQRISAGALVVMAVFFAAITAMRVRQ